DVFLAANCKFMLTCASGLSYMPALFGYPNVATNLITWYEVKGLHPRDISLPKKFYSKKFKRMLTFSETLGSYLIDHWMFYFFDAFGLQLIPNTQEEIYEATKEMLDRLENVYQEPSDAQILQRKFHKAIPDCL